MTPILEQTYRGYLLQITQWPNGLFAYQAESDSNDPRVIVSSGSYPTAAVAVSEALIVIDRIVDLPAETARLAQLIAEREQSLTAPTEDTNGTAA